MIKFNKHKSTYFQGISFINQEIQLLKDKIQIVYDKDLLADIYDSIRILKEFKKEYFKQLSRI